MTVEPATSFEEEFTASDVDIPDEMYVPLLYIVIEPLTVRSPSIYIYIPRQAVDVVKSKPESIVKFPSIRTKQRSFVFAPIFPEPKVWLPLYAMTLAPYVVPPTFIPSEAYPFAVVTSIPEL